MASLHKPAEQQQQPSQQLPTPLSPSDSNTAAVTEDNTSSEPETTHLARFEFSSNGSDTKILMVEWHPRLINAPPAPATPRATPDVASAVQSLTTTTTNTASSFSVSSSDDLESSTPGQKTPTAPSTSASNTTTANSQDIDGWEISWPGKSTNLPAQDTGSDSQTRRVFFLLPRDASIPTTVTITPRGSPSTTSLITTTSAINNAIQVKPLPAIFPESFDEEKGTCGVLHTLWAQRRVAELEREVEDEMRKNAESVGVEMALVEKQWIVDNFLKSPKQMGRVSQNGADAAAAVSPTASSLPRSPTGRLGEKLKGLKLATTPADLVPSPTANTFTNIRNNPYATQGDVAVASMSAISQSNRHNETASLDAALMGSRGASSGAPSAAAVSRQSQQQSEEEDDLFALPMSPRSPDMQKSPFSMLK